MYQNLWISGQILVIKVKMCQNLLFNTSKFWFKDQNVSNFGLTSKKKVKIFSSSGQNLVQTSKFVKISCLSGQNLCLKIKNDIIKK